MAASRPIGEKRKVHQGPSSENGQLALRNSANSLHSPQAGSTLTLNIENCTKVPVPEMDTPIHRNSSLRRRVCGAGCPASLAVRKQKVHQGPSSENQRSGSPHRANRSAEAQAQQVQRQLDGGGVSVMGGPVMLDQYDFSPVLQMEDGTFVGESYGEVDYMVGFDQSGSVQWAVPRYTPLMATADGSVTDSAKCAIKYYLLWSRSAAGDNQCQ